LDRDTVRSKRLIRQLLAQDAPAFLRAALPILKRQSGSPGAQFLAAALAESGLLLEVLADPGMSKACALEAARAAIAHDSAAGVTVAGALVKSVSGHAELLNAEQAGRIMEVLCEISDGNRIFPSLVRLLRHGDASVRSKAVLMIGRGSRSTKWVRRRLEDTDP